MQNSSLDGHGFFDKKRPGLNPLQSEFLTTDDVILVPSLGKLNSRSDASIDPFIYSSPMDTVTGYKLTKSMVKNGHYAVVCRFTPKEWIKTFKEFGDDPNVFFAVGSNPADLNKIETLAKKYWPNNKISINIDVAHGDTIYTHDLYRAYSKMDCIGSIMSGSICTPDAAIRAVQSGCTHLRVGIGPGSACTTRLKTGCGMPQLSAVYLVDSGLKSTGYREGVQIIADGGIRYPGDAVKYLAAGADGVMIGRLFSKTAESCGWKTIKDSWWRPSYIGKRYRGQASKQFQVDTFGVNPACPEGASGPVITPENTVKEVLAEFEGGVRSALSYLGITSMSELNTENVQFIRTTNASIKENTSHGF